MEEELVDEQPQLLDFQELAGIVRRRRWHFLASMFTVWLVVWIVSWFLPSIYRSGTLILVEQPAVPEKFVASNIDNDIQRQLDSISQQILSRTRLLQIIDRLNLYGANGSHKSPDELVEAMRRDIEIELSKGDDRKLTAFNIYYSNRDPKMAQAGTRELANLFISENLEQRQIRSENTTKFLQEQLDEARGTLAEQEARVREFKDMHVGELPSQTQSNLQILGGLQSQLQAQEDSLSRARQQNTYLESLLGQYRNLEHGFKPGETGPARLAAIDKELEGLRTQLTDLRSRYTDKHPDVRKTKELIASTERLRQLALEELNNPDPNNLENSAALSMSLKSGPVLELESQLKANRGEIDNRQVEIRDLRTKIGEYQGRLNRAPLMEQQFADITRDYDQSKATYDSLLAKKNQSEMATDLERTQQGEHFRMLDPPNLPAKPDRPNRMKLNVVGLVLGFVLGGGLAIATEFLSGKVHSERGIRKIVPFEVLAEIPVLATTSEQGQSRRRTLLAALAATVIFFSLMAGTAITYLRG